MRWLGFVLSGMLILAGGLGTLAALGSNVYVSDGRGERYVQQDLVRQQILTLVSAAAAGLAGVVILTGCALAESLAGVRAILDEQRLRDAAARAARETNAAGAAPMSLWRPLRHNRRRRRRRRPRRSAPRPALATWGPAAPKPAADFEAAVAAEVPAVKNAALR